MNERAFRKLLLTFVALSTAHLFASDNKALVAARNRAANEKVFNIKSYGAAGDGVAMDTESIQKTIDACHAEGGGIVRIPAGDFQIGTIWLRSNITLSLDYGATLLGSTNIADYKTEGLSNPREGGPHCLLYAENATDITIEGLGVIDGRGTPDFFPRTRSRGRETSKRPRLLRMVNCDRLTVSGVTYKRPAFWGLHLIDCRNIHFDAVTIRFRNNNYNNDGLDIDGCENVHIENCDIDSGDDAICLKSTLNPCRNIVVRGCLVSSNTAAFKCGTSSRGGFINVRVTNCHFYNSPMGTIKLELVDGGRLENIDISRIVMENVGNPIFIRLGKRGRTYARQPSDSQGADVQPDGAPIGTLKNVRIRDVLAEVTIESGAEAARATYRKPTADNAAEVTDQQQSKAGPIMITGIPGHYVEDVVLQNVKISYPGGGTSEHAKRTVPEDVARYPEQFFFGVLPAWGAYIRHARGVQFENVQLRTLAPDKRERIVLDDVDGFIECVAADTQLPANWIVLEADAATRDRNRLVWEFELKRPWNYFVQAIHDGAASTLAMRRREPSSFPTRNSENTLLAARVPMLKGYSQEDTDASFAGKKGGVAWLSDVKDGHRLQELRFDAAPVWDGIAIAHDNYFICLRDGSIVCLSGT